MSLMSNPFYVLGATPSDNRRRIIALANDKRFDGNEAAVREARGILITPRKRLKAEVAWLPELEFEQICQILAERSGNPAVVLQMSGLPTLAHANLLADGLVEENHEISIALHKLAEWIVELSAVLERIRADEVTTAVNEARLVAGIPMANQQDVAEELRDRRGYYRGAIERCLDKMALSRVVMVVGSVVNLATQKGTQHAPSAIDNLVDSYYNRRIRGELTTSGNRIEMLVSHVRDLIGGKRLTDIPHLVDQIKNRVEYWDVLAQPVQVSLASRGMSHPPSNEMMHEVRGLAIDLFNEHGLLDVAQGLTMTLREVFAEMEPITEILDRDLSTLDGFTRTVEAPSARTVKSNRRRNWIAAAFVVSVILVIDILTGTPDDTEPGVATQEPRHSPIQSMDMTAITRFSMPETGNGNLLNTSEIRWCLREEIRIETWRQGIVANAQKIDAFNEAIDNYNDRCGDYRYATASMAEARRDVDVQESGIIAEARRSPPWGGR